MFLSFWEFDHKMIGMFRFLHEQTQSTFPIKFPMYINYLKMKRSILMRFQEGSVAREEVHLQFYEASDRDAVEDPRYPAELLISL